MLRPESRDNICPLVRVGFEKGKPEPALPPKPQPPEPPPPGPDVYIEKGFPKPEK